MKNLLFVPYKQKSRYKKNEEDIERMSRSNAKLSGRAVDLLCEVDDSGSEDGIMDAAVAVN